MPNYRGGSAINQECPHCGRRGEHKVPPGRTDKDFYHWSKERTPFFERIAGSDLSYRKRTRQCVACQKEFDTVEMSDKFLTALMNEIERLELEIMVKEIELKMERNEVADKLHKLQEVHRALAEKCQEHQSHIEGINQSVQELHTLVNEEENPTAI